MWNSLSGPSSFIGILQVIFVSPTIYWYFMIYTCDGINYYL